MDNFDTHDDTPSKGPAGTLVALAKSVGCVTGDVVWAAGVLWPTQQWEPESPVDDTAVRELRALLSSIPLRAASPVDDGTIGARTVRAVAHALGCDVGDVVWATGLLWPQQQWTAATAVTAREVSEIAGFLAQIPLRPAPLT